MNVCSLKETTQSHAGGIENDDTAGRSALPQFKRNRSLHILCIDDDALVREIMARCLTRFEHRVTVASGGKQGLELFRTATLGNQPYEVVITDLGMPDVNGQCVARAIKAESPQTPVIMMTGWGAIMDEEKEADLQVDAVVGKPACMRELNDLVLRITAPLYAKC
jgi:DNA-binding response OmpR family regulator